MKLQRHIQPERAQGRGRPQQRQHDDQKHPRLGAGHALPHGMAKTYAWIDAAISPTAKPARRTVRDTV